jgi:hypothetical protein
MVNTTQLPAYTLQLLYRRRTPSLGLRLALLQPTSWCSMLTPAGGSREAVTLALLIHKSRQDIEIICRTCISCFFMCCLQGDVILDMDKALQLTSLSGGLHALHPASYHR